MLYLQYFKDGIPKTLPLSRPVVHIGRDGDNDIVLGDPNVSRRHCRLEVSGGRVTLTDLDTVNGVFVGGRKVHHYALRVNDSFWVGDCRFHLQEGELEEVEICRELSDIGGAPPEKAAGSGSAAATTEARTRYDALLEQILDTPGGGFDDFLDRVRAALSVLIRRGSLYLCGPEMVHGLADPLRLGVPPLQWSEMEAGAWPGPGYSRLTLESRAAPGRWVLWFVHPPGCSAPSESLHRFLRQLMEVVELRLGLTPALSFPCRPDAVLYEGGDPPIIGISPALRQLAQVIRKIAPKGLPVLIGGENGTGKELFARMIHGLSSRQRYVAVNCAAIPTELLESELFGHEKGAFTDARGRRTGQIVAASGGTLVFDEIGDMPLATQAKLLRVLQERAVTPLGRNEPIPVDIRVIAMTNQDLYRQAAEGTFRADLFFRLRGHELWIPPLRERREDIVPLIRYYTRVFAARNGVQPGPYSQEAADCLKGYDWPGNARELANEIARLMEVVEDGEVIRRHHLLSAITGGGHRAGGGAPGPASGPIRERLEVREREELLQLLQHHQGNKKRAAQAEGMSYRGFLKKLARLGIE